MVRPVICVVKVRTPPRTPPRAATATTITSVAPTIIAAAEAGEAIKGIDRAETIRVTDKVEVAAAKVEAARTRVALRTRATKKVIGIVPREDGFPRLTSASQGTTIRIT